MSYRELPYRVKVNDVLQAAFADKENADNFVDACCEAAITGDVIHLIHIDQLIGGFDADGNELKLG